MEGSASANVVDLGFAGEAGIVSVGLPEEQEKVSPLGVLAAERRAVPGSNIGRTRGRLAAGVGTLISSLSMAKRAKSVEAESAGVSLDEAAPVASSEGEESAPDLTKEGAAAQAKSLSPKRSALMTASVSIVALSAAAGLAVFLLPSHHADHTAVVSGRPGTAADPSKTEGPVMAPLASLSTVTPREGLQDPVVVLPRPADKDGLVAEVAALGPSAPEKDGIGKEKKGVREVGVAPVAAVDLPKEMQAPLPFIQAAPLQPNQRYVLPSKAAARGVGSDAGGTSQTVSIIEKDATPGLVAPPAPMDASEPGVKENRLDAGKKGLVEAVPPEQETVVSAMITELSTDIHKMSDQLMKLKVEQKKLADATAGKLADFERRLNIGEARRALDGASAAVVEASLPAQTGETATTVVAPAQPLLTAPVKHPAAKAADKTDNETTESSLHYRVRAASPGLAMLAAIDQTGDDRKPLQVGVGGQVPGYGRVTKIAQRGLAWVVETEKGEIR